MPRHRTPPRIRLPFLLARLTAARPACRQARTCQRLVLRSLALGWALCRHTLSQLLVTRGVEAGRN
jgi:hypothetical protein